MKAVKAFQLSPASDQAKLLQLKHNAVKEPIPTFYNGVVILQHVLSVAWDTRQDEALEDFLLLFLLFPPTLLRNCNNFDTIGDFDSHVHFGTFVEIPPG